MTTEDSKRTRLQRMLDGEIEDVYADHNLQSYQESFNQGAKDANLDYSAANGYVPERYSSLLSWAHDLTELEPGPLPCDDMYGDDVCADVTPEEIREFNER